MIITISIHDICSFKIDVRIYELVYDVRFNDATNKETIIHLSMLTAMDIAPKYVIINGIPTSMVSRLC